MVKPIQKLRCSHCGNFQTGIRSMTCKRCNANEHEYKEQVWHDFSEDLFWCIKSVSKSWGENPDRVIKMICKK